MSTPVDQFSITMTDFFDRLDAAHAGLLADVNELNRQIHLFQNATGGGLSAADQATLDNIRLMADAMVQKFESLDAMTPPAFVS